MSDDKKDKPAPVLIAVIKDGVPHLPHCPAVKGRGEWLSGHEDRVQW